MSATIGYELHARNPEDFEKMAAYATELTRKASLERLGYDITNPDENPEKEFQSFYVGDSGNAICWEDFTGGTKHLDIKIIIDQIVHHFPKMEFTYRAFGEGPLAYEAYIKGDIRERLLNKVLHVGIEDPKALCKVLKEMPDVRQSGPFLIFPFMQYPVSRFKEAVAEILQKVGAVIPDTELYCVIWDDDADGGSYDRKGIYSQGQIIWEDITADEIRAIILGLGVFDEPTEEVLGVLFKGLQVALPETYISDEDNGDNDEDGLPL